MKSGKLTLDLVDYPWTPEAQYLLPWSFPIFTNFNQLWARLIPKVNKLCKFSYICTFMW